MIALNVVETSTPDTFDFLAYSPAHPSTINYLQNQFANISNTILDSGRKFIEEGKVMMEKFCDGTIDRAARAALRMATNVINPNLIQRLDSLEDIQMSGPLMQRYIMSEPYIREKFHQQTCSGYAGSYVDLDPDPSFLREWHYDWRRVHDGIVEFKGEGDQEQWVSTTYFEELREGDRNLDFLEKIDIISTQELARLYMEHGQDATNPFGGEVG